MKVKRFIIIILAACIFNYGCIAAFKTKAKTDKNTKEEIYKFDLDADGKRETVKIEAHLAAEANFKMTITGFDKNNIENIMVTGRFRKIEFIDLEDKGSNEIVLYYEDNQDYSNLIIYSFKNNRLHGLFSVTKACDIETSFTSALSKIKISRPKCEGQDCVCARGSQEEWVWVGEKFIRY